jgi:D-serine deaminase-like pyridoxal phosphate-dependent protein
MNPAPWYTLKSEANCISPSLLVFPDRIEHNIKKMVQMTGDPLRLRPHIKTHKMAEVIRMQMKHGINKFKCATIAEAELLGICQAPDALLAMQPVAINIDRFLNLPDAYPATIFSTLLDDAYIARELNEKAGSRNLKVPVFMDLNVGMDRTGIRPDDSGVALYKELSALPNLVVKGLHAYDGHIRNTDLEERTKECDACFEGVTKLKKELEDAGYPVAGIIAGGSPTFPIHCRRPGVEASPGTTLLWDERYASSFPDMDFQIAAVLLTRIVSKPGDNLLCLDLGHKAIAAEMPFPRLRLLGMEECVQLSQSEEHLVVTCPDAGQRNTGEAFYAIPMHICPTVARYPSVMTVEAGAISGSWKVAARDHRLHL